MRHGCLLLTTLALALLDGCADSPQKAEGPWGAPNDGFQAMLLSPRATVTLGEPIELQVRIRNLVGEHRSFPSAGDLTLKVMRGDADVADDMDYVNLAPEAIPLAPGQERVFPLKKYPTGDAAAPIGKQRGLYRFSGRLGKLALPPIEIRVE